MVLVFVEHNNGNFKKTALEAMTYGKKTADALGVECKALTFGNNPAINSIGEYGASEILVVDSEHLSAFDSQVYSNTIADIAKANNASVIVTTHNSSGMGITGRLAIKLNAACGSGVNSLPVVSGSDLIVEKKIFSGKAISKVKLSGEVKVISVTGNTLPPEQTGSACPVTATDVSVDAPKVKVISHDKQSGGALPLPEAELVVSAGRGMKGPENWGIIEELAAALGATTACSRPVADTGWRPHHEHVGQTGVAIRPNLYIAAGISGAIQHLAGVNSSKCIVVINKDPEAPFFKAADYGVCADLFDVVPKLTAAIKKAKGN